MAICYKVYKHMQQHFHTMVTKTKYLGTVNALILNMPFPKVYDKLQNTFQVINIHFILNSLFTSVSGLITLPPFPKDQNIAIRFVLSDRKKQKYRCILSIMSSFFPFSSVTCISHVEYVIIIIFNIQIQETYSTWKYVVKVILKI